MPAFTEILGEKLRMPDATTVRTKEKLEGKKVVALYFSASWSPPCEKFTPFLARQYKHVYMEKGMEIVLVSHDCDERQFRKAHHEVSFPALPYPERGMKDALSKMCKVTDLPALVLLTPQGTIYNYDARKIIKEPEDFPWIPKSLSELLAGPFTSHAKEDNESDSESVDADDLEGKYIGLYFGATWCKPCKAFAPKLASTYKKIKTRDPNAKFEIIYVSDDLDEAQFKENFKKMPWIALPFSERDSKDCLRKIFEVSDLPSLVILDKDQETILNENARDSVEADPEGLNFPWRRQKAADRFATLLKGLQDGTQPLFGDKKPQESPSPSPMSSPSSSSSSSSCSSRRSCSVINIDDDNKSQKSDSSSSSGPSLKKARVDNNEANA